MARRQLSRKRLFLRVELLETRTVLSPLVIMSSGTEGPQVGIVQGYNSALSTVSAILDTGSPSVTFSPTARSQLGIPVLVAGGAVATGIGGTVRGDVSMPGAIYVNGTQTSARSPGIQAFLGTAAGSPFLPTVAGTPVFEPSAVNPAGLAGLISLPTTVGAAGSLQLVSPQTTLVASSGSNLVNISLSLSGEDNHLNPGNQLTVAPVPIDTSVTLAVNSNTASDSDFLFDTGSQVTILSPALASSLGVHVPQTTNPLQGAGGSATAGALVLSSLTLGNAVTFMNVPVAVLNIGSGFDGILGMNLFSHATSMLYNPYGQGGPSLSVVFPASASPMSTPSSPTGPYSGPTSGSGPLTRPSSPYNFEISVVLAQPLSRSAVSLTAVPAWYYGAETLLVAGQQSPTVFGLQIGFGPMHTSGNTRSVGQKDVIFPPVRQSGLEVQAVTPIPVESGVPDRVPDRSSNPVQREAAPSGVPARPPYYRDQAVQDQANALDSFPDFQPLHENLEAVAAPSRSEPDILGQLAIVVAGVWGSLHRDNSRAEEKKRLAF